MSTAFMAGTNNKRRACVESIADEPAATSRLSFVFRLLFAYH